MITCDNHDLQLWVMPVRFPQKTEKTALGGCRRIGNIENIACYQQDISLP